MKICKYTDAFDGVIGVLQFGKFLFEGAEWGKFGILLLFEGINNNSVIFSVRPSRVKSDEIKYEAIIQILGNDRRIILRKNILDVLPGLRWLNRVYRACIKVHNMKCFL
jgi:hypothetical protein